MKISIITVCFNSSATIKDTIISVASQKNVKIEHIIIDGGSNDGTVEIVKSYPSVTKFISEPDKGIYDAMNKGIALATGDVVGTLNADDFYANPHVLEEVSKVFLDANVDACYGDLLYVNQHDTDRVVRYWKSKNYVLGLFKSGWMPAHPTFFVRKNIYERFGGFNLNYTIAADFELLFRLIEQNGIITKYIPMILVKMRVGGTTNNSLKNILTQNNEIISILERHYRNFSLLNFIKNKLINRFLQLVSRPVE
jgi:glycosyltransferase involved in cell wall biosynthesis